MPLAKTKKKVPGIVEQFWAMDEERQIAAVNIGSWDDDLEVLRCHSQMGTVQTVINRRIREIGKTAVAVVEKGKCATMAHLQTIATQVNEKFERFQVVEKEATMLMLEIGLTIEYVKEQLPHGQLEKWVNSNLTISKSHARRFRELARVFISANSLKNDECFLLCDPANSKEALGEKLRQMAFDFLGDKTQAELFEQYKIKYQEKAEPKPLNLPKPKPLDPGETQAHRTATELIYPLMTQIQRWMVSDERMVQHLNMNELKVLQGDLIDAKRIVDQLIKAG